MTAARIRFVARVGGPRSTLPPFVVLSIAMHVTFVAAMLLLPSLRPKRSFPIEPSIQAVLLPAPAPRRASPPATPAATVAPEPETAEPELTAAEEVPKAPVPDPNPPAKPKPKKKPEPPKPRPAPPKPQSTAPAAAGQPAAGAAGPVGNPEGADALAGMGSEFNWYRDAVARALYSSWQQPMLNAGEPVEVAVAFEIVRSGAVRNVRLERTSGDAVVDRSVLRAVHDATLPPLPRNYGQSVQPALFVFRLYPE